MLSTSNVVPFETFSHPVCLLLVVSSRSPDPLGALKKLYESSSASSALFAQRAFVDTTVMRSYVLLHDASAPGERGSSRRSEEVLAAMKRAYGLNCSLVRINSAAAAAAGAERGGGGAVVSQDEALRISRLWQDALGDEQRVRFEDVSLDENTDQDAAPDSSSSSPRMHMTRASLDRGPSPSPPAGSGSGSAGVRRVRYGVALSAADVAELQTFLRVFAAQSLIPWMERSVQQWHTQLQESRKGLTNRLFGAGRSLFGRASASAGAGGQSGSGGGGGASGSYNPALGGYAAGTTEAQTRRLADFAFMLHDYTLAAATYEQARKDFTGDKAYLHAACALSMMGLSQLMGFRQQQQQQQLASTAAPAPASKQLIRTALECEAHFSASRAAFAQAIGVMTGSAAEEEVRFAALRAVLLQYEAERALGLCASAASALRKAADASVDDISAGMLLEQAALMHLRRAQGSGGALQAPFGKNAPPDARVEQPPALRRAAVDLLTAAHAYRQCGQRQLAARCFESAYSSAPLRQWAATDSHLERQLVQQAQRDPAAVEASIEHSIRLLQQGYGSADEQGAFLQQLIVHHKAAVEQGKRAAGAGLELVGAFVDVASAKIVPSRLDTVTLVGCQLDPADDAHWSVIIKDFKEEVKGSAAFDEAERKKLARVEKLDDESAYIAQIGERIAVRLRLRNPLACQASISHLKVEVSLDSASEQSDGVETPPAAPFTLAAGEARDVELYVTAKQVGNLRISAVTFTLQDELPVRQALDGKKGKRLNQTRAHKLEPTYGPDTTLTCSIGQPRPVVQLSVTEWPSSMLLGEEFACTLSIANISDLPAKEVAIFLAEPTAALYADGSEDSSNSIVRERIVKRLAVLSGSTSETLQLSLRACEIGSQKSHILAVYLDEGGTPHSALCTCSTEVAPSLSLSATSSGAGATPSSWSILTEVRNLSDSTLEIESITGLSSHWQQQDDTARDSGEVLHPGQDTLAPLRFRQTSHGQDELAFVVQQLRTLLREKKPDQLARPPTLTDMASWTRHASPFYIASKRSWRRASLAQDYPSIPASYRNATFVTHEPDDIDLAVRWRLPDGRSGTCYLFGLHAGPRQSRLASLLVEIASGTQTRSMYAQTAKEAASLWSNVLGGRHNAEDNPIEVRFSAARKAQHAFDDSGPLVLPVQVHAVNHSASRHAQVELQLHSIDTTQWVLDESAMRLRVGRLTASFSSSQLQWHARGALGRPSYVPSCSGAPGDEELGRRRDRRAGRPDFACSVVRRGARLRSEARERRCRAAPRVDADRRVRRLHDQRRRCSIAACLHDMRSTFTSKRAMRPSFEPAASHRYAVARRSSACKSH